MNINGFGGLNKLFQSGSAASKPASQAGGSSVAGGGLKQDTVQFSVGSKLGTDVAPTLSIAGIPVKLDASSLHPSTLNTLKNAPEHSSAFPPFTDIQG